jgi:hypothetical protein
MSTTYRVRLTDDWLPLPPAVAAAFDPPLREGDIFEAEVIGDTLVLTRQIGRWQGTVPEHAEAK